MASWPVILFSKSWLVSKDLFVYIPIKKVLVILRKFNWLPLLTIFRTCLVFLNLYPFTNFAYAFPCEHHNTHHKISQLHIILYKYLIICHSVRGCYVILHHSYNEVQRFSKSGRFVYVWLISFKRAFYCLSKHLHTEIYD